MSRQLTQPYPILLRVEPESILLRVEPIISQYLSATPMYEESR